MQGYYDKIIMTQRKLYAIGDDTKIVDNAKNAQNAKGSSHG